MRARKRGSAVAGAAFVLALLSAAGSAAYAQESRPLTLEQARAIAAENNPVYRRAENAVVSARAGELLSRSQFLPTLGASFSSGGSLSRRRTGENDFGQPIEGEEVREFTGSSSNQGISLNWQLFNGGGRFREVRAAAAGREAAVAGVEAAEATVLAELTRRYYEAQRAAALIQLEEQLLEAAEARREATERLLRVASASPVDLLGAELEVARQREALESARGSARVAKLALAEQMGVEMDAEWELVSEPPPVFDPSTLDADALVERAHAVSPQLRQIALTAEQAEQQRRAAGAARWPTISLNTSFGRSIGARGYGALFEPNPFDQNLSFGISISLPLFSQYQTGQRITQARVAAANADEDARQTRLQLEREVRTALIELEGAYRTVELNNASTELARRRLELANERFRLGAIPFTEMQQIIADAATAEREALNARYAFAAALATLEERVGMENGEWRIEN